MHLVAEIGPQSSIGGAECEWSSRTDARMVKILIGLVVLIALLGAYQAASRGGNDAIGAQLDTRACLERTA